MDLCALVRLQEKLGAKWNLAADGVQREMLEKEGDGVEGYTTDQKSDGCVWWGVDDEVGEDADDEVGEDADDCDDLLRSVTSRRWTRGRGRRRG